MNDGRRAGEPSMTPDDRVQRERLLRGAVLAGDRRAWHVWYEESYGPLYAYVHWRSGGLEELAEEVVQETWLVAVRRVRAFDPGQASFLAWLRGIAANVLRNRLRARRVWASRAESLQGEPEGDAPVDAELIRRERAERIAAALADLPDHYEAVLRAKYLEGCSVAQIAEASGQTSKAVESRLSRARQAFRETYQALQSSGNVRRRENELA